MAGEIAKWKRFEKATFTWDSSAAVATFAVEIPTARSSAAAIGEARNAIANILYAAVKEPGDYAIKALKVEWLSAD